MTFRDRFDRGLRTAGGALVRGFGPKMAIGYFVASLDDVTVDQLYEYINAGRSFFGEVFNDMSEEQLTQYRELAHEYLNGPPSTDDVLKSLTKNRPDLAGVLVNDPRGLAWLERELQIATEKLA